RAKPHGRWGADAQDHVAVGYQHLIVDRVTEIARPLDRPPDEVCPDGCAPIGTDHVDLVRTDRDDQRRPALDTLRRETKSQRAPTGDARLLGDGVHEIGPADELGDEARPRT